MRRFRRFNPLYAAGVCLIANTAPVAFGAIGIPIIVGAQTSGVNEPARSQMVGRTLPFLSVLIPLYITILMAGWKKGLEVWPACLVSGGSFAQRRRPNRGKAHGRAAGGKIDLTKLMHA